MNALRESNTLDLPESLRERPARLSEKYPFLYNSAVCVHRFKRHLQWLQSKNPWATQQDSALRVRVYTHKSLLRRTLGNSEMWLQHNKIHNLHLACPHINSLILRPRETFSFCRAVGKTTKRKGYKVGMLLDNGEAKPGIGDGICQLANLLHWMVLHTPLTVVERSQHSYDPFPIIAAYCRGTGCAIYYNYVDLQFRNDTKSTFQLQTRVGDKYLEGEIRADE